MPFISCAQQTEMVIGINDKGTYQITASFEEIKILMQNGLKEAEITANLVNFEIRSDIVEDSKETYYYLIGSNDNGNIKIVTQLQTMGNTFAALLSEQLPSTPRKTCTCSGSCTKGCDPKIYKDKEGDLEWKCSSCTQTGKSCKKSVTDSM